jgi:hypothetical protein
MAMMPPSLVENIMFSSLKTPFLTFQTLSTPSSTNPAPYFISNSQVDSSAIKTTLSVKEMFFHLKEGLTAAVKTSHEYILYPFVSCIFHCYKSCKQSKSLCLKTLFSSILS